MGRTQRQRLRNKRQHALARPNCEQAAAVLQLYRQLLQMGWRNHSKLCAQNFKCGDRGICSKQSCCFQSGDVLIELPIRCLISIASIEADNEFKLLFDSSQFAPDSCISLDILMSLYLLYHKHTKCNDFMQTYLATIPDAFATPFFCDTAELQHLPEALLLSNWQTLCKIREGITKLRQCMLQSRCPCCHMLYFDEIFTLHEFKWAYFVIQTRSVYINSLCLLGTQTFFFKSLLLTGQHNFALAPFLDLFNHSNDVSTSADLQQNALGEQQYVLTLLQTTAPIKRFQQIFISYGTLNNFRLLTQYGFIIANNKHHFIEFNQQDIEALLRKPCNSQQQQQQQQQQHRNKFVFLREHNFFDNMFLHASEGISHNLRVVLYILFKQSSHYANVLNQLAYGDAEQFENLDVEINELISLKILEYETFSKDLSNKQCLSNSGRMVLDYMTDAIELLKHYQIQCHMEHLSLA